MSKLRKALGDGVLVTRGGGYVLLSERVEVDADRFEALVSAAHCELQAGNRRTASESLRETLGLWRFSG